MYDDVGNVITASAALGYHKIADLSDLDEA